MKIPESVVSNLGLPHDHPVGCQITRAELEQLYPGSDDYGDVCIEVFKLAGKDKETIIAYLPASKTWEVMLYMAPDSSENYWAQL